LAATRRVTGERQRRRTTRAGTLLSEAAIVDCALRLIGEHGAEALSARRIGAALGCDPSALYRYVTDMDDLVLAIADRLIGEALDGFDPGAYEDWSTALRAMAFRLRDAYRDHPRAAAMASYRITRRPNEFRAVETGVGLLRRAGFDGREAVRLYLTFIDTVLGHAALEAAQLALPAERADSDRRAWTAAYQSAAADSYPQLAAVRAHLPLMADSTFEPAVDLMLSALRAQAPSPSASPRPGPEPPDSGGPAQQLS